MIVGHPRNRKLIYQSNDEKMEKIVQELKEKEVVFTFNDYTTFKEIWIDTYQKNQRIFLERLQKKYDFSFETLDYGFNEIENNLDGYYQDGVIEAINQKYETEFKDMQEAIKYYVDDELKQASINESFKDTELYYSLLRIVMAENLKRSKIHSGKDFLEQAIVQPFIKFYNPLSQAEKERFHHYTIQMLENLGYIIY